MRGRVLIVEDEPDIRAFLDEELTDAGYAVSRACNGAKAIDAIGTAPPNSQPDLILLDLYMPVMDGRTFVS